MDRERLSWFEAIEFAELGILVPPHAALPDGFEVSNEGLVVPPVPTRGDLREKIAERRRRLPDWTRALPKYAARSDYWRMRFAYERRKALGLCNAHLRAVLPHERTPL